MAPIRVAIIGLSQSAKTSWASQAHLPYLLSERGRQRYKITALLNSSKEAAEKAITTYNLSSDVKAYGSPDDLAADSNVDLVVCATRVDVHFGTVEPNVKAGKNVFVEWPLAENVDRATQLANWAKESGSKTLIGLQARVAPSVRKVKDLIESGVIGRVVSSAVQAYTPVGGGDSISEGLGYFLDKKIGGNPVTIVSKLLGVIPTETSETCAYYAQRMLGHMIDFVHAVLGEYESSSAQVQIQRPNQKIIDRDTGATKSTTSDVPDLVSIHGTLRASDYVSHGASLTVNFRTGPPFPGTKPFVWVIVGEKCRIEVSNESSPSIAASAAGLPTPIRVEDNTTKEIKEVPWEWEDWQEALNPRGRSIAKIYDLYYEGKAHDTGVADFSTAAARHAELDKLLYR